VAVSESDPDIVYIGMGETELRGNIMQGDGVYTSTDAGRTWKHMGLADTQAIARIRVHPINPDIVYAAALGHPYGPNEERGGFRSKDGGQTWQKVLYRNDHAGAIDLCFDMKNPQALYAAIWDVYRRPWTLSSGGSASGLFKSSDGGDHWTEITRNPGLPKGVIGKIGVSVSGTDSNRVYAIIEAVEGGLFASDDAGATWKRVSEDPRLRQRAFYYSRIYADPQGRDIVYVLKTGMYRSTDGGKTFRTIRTPHGDNHDLWIAPNDPRRMIESNDGGGNVSFNGGETWTRQEYPTAQLYHVVFTRDIPYHICGAQQDSSTVCVSSAPARGGGDGVEITPVMYAVGGGESGYIASDPAHPNVFYAGGWVSLTRFDRRTGYTRDVQVYPMNLHGQPASADKERWNWSFPIVFSPDDFGVVYAASQHLWRTTNEGLSWEQISPDLTRADPKTLRDSGGPITHDQTGPEIYATIFTVAPSLKESNTIWTGSDDGLVHITRDGGKNWTKITPRDLPEFSTVSLIDASPHRAGAAQVAVKRYQLDDRRPYIYKTEDYGKTWTKIVNGIRADDYVHAVREDPKRPGLLFAGAEHGVYVSFDDGAHWQSLSLNLPDTQVPDLVVGDDLVIATHGRSFYVLDDISPLREMTDAVATADAHLFRPETAVRNVRQANVAYYLKRADKVVIEVLDAEGHVVRAFTGTAADDRRPGPGNGEGHGEFEGQSFAAPSRKDGLNRFSWDLRYPGAKGFAGVVAGMRGGPLAVPGSYQVRLTANGRTLTQSFSVQKDPRLDSVTIADLAEQFRLALEVRNKTTEANEIVILIRELKKQMKDLLQRVPDAALRTAMHRFGDKLTAVEEEIYQVRNRSNQDFLNFGYKINGKLAMLQGIIERGDGKPTAGAYTVFKELSDQLAAQKTRLDQALQTDLPQLNRLLAEHSLKELTPIRTETR
jgi:photosystem II stability/assembly factor-like uncharacterized protein